MAYRLIVKNPINTDRFITDYGFTPKALIGVDLILEGMVDEPEGFMMSMLDAQQMFIDMFGYCWNRATLIERGEQFVPPAGPTVYVDFSPSLENIAKHVFDHMMPEMLQRYNVMLVGVAAVSEMGDALYMKEAQRNNNKQEVRYC